jgi:putative resolvase
VRYYDLGKILGLGSEDLPIIGYASVSSHDQKNDLVRQQELLEAFCQPKASSPISVLQRLLELILLKRIHPLVLAHKDRLLRFGSELILALREIQNIEIVIINKGEPPSFEPRT